MATRWVYIIKVVKDNKIGIQLVHCIHSVISIIRWWVWNNNVNVKWVKKCPYNVKSYGRKEDQRIENLPISVTKDYLIIDGIKFDKNQLVDKNWYHKEKDCPHISDVPMEIKLGSVTTIIIRNDNIIHIENYKGIFTEGPIMTKNDKYIVCKIRHNQVPPYHGMNGSVIDWI